MKISKLLRLTQSPHRLGFLPSSSISLENKLPLPIKLSLVALSLGGCSLNANALNNNQLDSLDDFVSLSLHELSELRVTTTASGYLESEATAPASITTLHEEEWRLMNDKTLFDILEQTPGVSISTSQFVFGSDVAIFRGLRDENNAGLKLLIDGQPVEFVYTSGFFYTFETSLNGLDRVEIIRGPGSALYGSDAFAGVINLIPQTDPNKRSASLAIGEQESLDFSLTGGVELGAFEGVNIIGSFNYRRTETSDDREITSDYQTIIDGMQNTSASLAPGNFDDHHEIIESHVSVISDNFRLHWWSWHNLDGGAGPGVADALDPNADIKLDIDFITGRYTWNDLISNDSLEWNTGIQNHYQKIDLRLFPAGAKIPINANGNIILNPNTPISAISSTPVFSDGVIGVTKLTTKRAFTNFAYLIDLGDHRIRAQAGYEYQSMNTSERKNFGNGVLNGSELTVDGTLTNLDDTEFVYAPDSRRHFHFISLQDQWEVTDTIKLIAGVRHDKYSDFGATTNLRATLIWSLENDTTMKFMYGESFQAPSFQELFNQNNPVLLGNKNLKPETINTSEFEWKRSFGDNASLQINLYHYDAENLIAFSPKDGKAQNTSEQQANGAEILFSLKAFDDWHFFAHHSYVSAKDEFNQPVASIPKNTSYFLANWRAKDNLNIAFRALHNANYIRSHTDTRDAIDNKLVFNTTINYTPDLAGSLWNSGQGNKLTLSLIGKNLFNKKNKDPSNGLIANDYPLEGRRIWLNAKYDF